MARRDKLRILGKLVRKKMSECKTKFLSGLKIEEVSKITIAMFDDVLAEINALGDRRKKTLRCVACKYKEEHYYYAPNKKVCPKCKKWMEKYTAGKKPAKKQVKVEPKQKEEKKSAKKESKKAKPKKETSAKKKEAASDGPEDEPEL